MSATIQPLTRPDAASPHAGATTDKQQPLREAFDQFVGQTFYGQMLKAMRKTVDKPAYFHGGRGEEVFQNQFDQALVERMSKHHAGQFSGAMFDQFVGNLRRK